MMKLMPRTVLSTFLELESDGRTLVVTTVDTQAAVPIDKIDYVTYDASTNSPTLTIHSREASATVTYLNRDALDADWSELVELLGRPEQDAALASQVEQNTADIAANQQGIVNLNNDLAGMFARLNDLEAHVAVLTTNMNALGERVTALEAQP